MHALDYLEENAVWETPDNYGGFDPVGDYCIMSRHRGGSILAESNWEVAQEEFKPEWFSKHPYEDDFEEAWKERPEIYMWRARSSLCGWIEYMMVRQDASDEVKERAGELVAALACYPVLDDALYSEMRMEKVEGYWNGMNMAERIEMCQDADVSIFAARREDDVPSEVVWRIEEFIN